MSAAFRYLYPFYSRVILCFFQTSFFDYTILFFHVFIAIRQKMLPPAYSVRYNEVKHMPEARLYIKIAEKEYIT